MKLGETQPKILADTIEIILKADKLKLLKKLDNQIITYMNNAPATIKLNIFEERLRSFNVFANHATRKFWNVITLK